jgi:glutamyl-tRNA synthetase
VAEELLRRDAAYICECDKDLFTKRILEGKPCPDREMDVGIHLERFRRMLDGSYPPGKAILRVRTDLSHPNPSVRDWPALRIIDTKRYPHPLTGSQYHTWPLYNFSCAVDDHLLGVTHIIRGVEHQVNTERQMYIYHHMGWTPPRVIRDLDEGIVIETCGLEGAPLYAIHYGRLGVSRGILSKSEILKGISEGLYLGCDDPRLATLASLRRRGFQPEAIRRIIYQVGLNPSPALIDWSNLEALNREIVDPRANRRFVVVDPYPLTIAGIPEPLHAEIRLHPDFPERGVRRFRLSPRDERIMVYIERSDAETFRRGSLVRLMGLLNMEVEEIWEDSGEALFKDYEVSTALRARAPLIHWVPSDPHVEVDLLWLDASTKHCLGEMGLLEERIGSIVQMERIGYARVDSLEEDKVSLIFSHK